MHTRMLSTPVAYLRVSTDDQRDRGTIDTQRLTIERYCARNGLHLVDLYTDEGISGFTPLAERPSGAHLLHDVFYDRVALVLVYAFDRLGRGEAAIAAVSTLLARGVEVRSVTQADIDVRTPQGWEAFVQEVEHAAHEYAMFQRRSTDGIERLVRAGAWVGGIVPFGYRVADDVDSLFGSGRRKARRLVVSNESLPDVGLSEAEVVRMMYRLCAVEGWSCHKIAEHLNTLGVLPVYARDQRGVLRGKHKVGTAGVWRAGRVRSVLANTTYKGLHTYGKRSASHEREVIERPIEPIIDADTWTRAQQMLRDHVLIAPDRKVRDYLLRGFMRCAVCGLTYIGVTYPKYGGGVKAYYVCSGKHNHRKLLRPGGVKCASKAIRAERIELAIWEDVQRILNYPASALRSLDERLAWLEGEIIRVRDEATRLKAILAALSSQSTARNTNEIGSIKATITEQLEQALAQEAQQGELRTVREMIERQLQPQSDLDFQRYYLESLIASATVDTVFFDGGKKSAVVSVMYCFGDTVVYYP